VGPLEAGFFVSIEDLVAGLARNGKLATEGGHLLPVEETGYEAKTLVFHVTLLPRHLCILRKGSKV
jgi:hypothetical protein